MSQRESSRHGDTAAAVDAAAAGKSPGSPHILASACAQDKGAEDNNNNSNSSTASVAAAGTPSARTSDNPFLYDGQSNLLVRIAQQKAEADRVNGDRDLTTVRRQQREGQLRQIYARRQRARRQFDLVEDLFTKSVERRLRALRRIADDPPAERLIGHSVAQYIPAALLPGELRQVQGYLGTREQAMTLPATQAVQAITAGEESGTAAQSPHAVSSSSGGGGGPTPIVFLTELGHDAKAHEKQRQGKAHAASQAGGPSTNSGVPASPSSASMSSSPSSSSSLDAHGEEVGRAVGRAGDEAEQRWMAAQEAALAAQWRELGYDVLYLHGQGTHRRLAPMSGSAGENQGNTDVQAPQEKEAGAVQRADLPHSRVAAMAITGSVAANRTRAEWVKTGLRLAPLPHICLVQRRLAPLGEEGNSSSHSKCKGRKAVPIEKDTASGKACVPEDEAARGAVKSNALSPWWMVPHTAWTRPVLKKPASRVCAPNR